jgi:hypothetical protein
LPGLIQNLVSEKNVKKKQSVVRSFVRLDTVESVDVHQSLVWIT